MTQMLSRLPGPLGRIISPAPSTGGGGNPFRNTEAILGAGGLDYAFYDSTALDRMWQEATGQTPANVNSPVGLIVGREKQQAKTFAQVMAGQLERAINGGFDTNLDGWIANNPIGSGGNAVWDSGNGGQAALPRTNVSNYARIYQAFSTVVGATYRAVTTIRSQTCEVRVGASAGGSDSFSATVGAGSTLERYFVATSTTSYLQIRCLTDGTTGYADNVSLKEVPAHYASQAVTNQRGQLQADGIKYDGVAQNHLTDWFAQAGANCIIAQVTVPVTISAGALFAGANNGTGGRWRAGFSTSGAFVAAVGNVTEATVTDGGDWRGQSILVAVSKNETVRLFNPNGLAFEQPFAGSLPTDFAVRMGAVSNSASPNSFFGGSIKRIAFGKTALTLEQFQSIRAEWLAAA